MAYVSEILFVDPSVDDVETILRGLRPGVEAKALDPAVPAAKQIAKALAAGAISMPFTSSLTARRAR